MFHNSRASVKSSLSTKVDSASTKDVIWILASLADPKQRQGLMDFINWNSIERTPWTYLIYFLWLSLKTKRTMYIFLNKQNIELSKSCHNSIRTECGQFFQRAEKWRCTFAQNCWAKCFAHVKKGCYTCILKSEKKLITPMVLLTHFRLSFHTAICGNRANNYIC